MSAMEIIGRGMETIDLLRELSKKPSREIEIVLTQLLLDGAFDYVAVSQMYVRSLEFKQRDLDTLLFEANSCIFDSFNYTRPPRSECHKRHLQRCLYHLNTYARNNFYLSNVNERFGYRECEGKSESVYEKRKSSNTLCNTFTE